MTYQIIHGDCLEVMAGLAAGSVDLIFADPPFNVGISYGGKASSDRRDDYYAWCARWIAEAFRLLSDSGTFYLMTIGRHVYQMGHEMGKHGQFVNKIEWHNVSAACSGKGFWPSTQTIWMFGKSESRVFNRFAQVRVTSLPWSAERQTNVKGQLSDYWDDITFVYAGSIRHPEAIMVPGTNSKAHPAQMPIALASRAIYFSSNEGATVLDPFCGSGTTGVACIQTGRNFIGIEIDEGYCKIAERRCAEAAMQGRLL